MIDRDIEAKSIFYRYLDEKPADKTVFLHLTCGMDIELRQQVELLLNAYEEESLFLELPVAKPLAGLGNLLGGMDSRTILHETKVETSPVAKGDTDVPGGQTNRPGRVGFSGRIGEYEIIDTLGQGGMSVVYKARHVELNRTVALKIARSGTDAKELHRFRTEAEAVAGLDHPNVVKIFEVGTHEGLPYFALEYCPEGSLEKRLPDGRRHSARVAKLVEQIARGAAAAHAQGVVHRDLKPANVLLGCSGQAKVTDFGLAKRSDAEGPTLAGMILGTPSHMAPEQATGGKRVGPAADVWALGVILYQLLTGKLPFEANNAVSTLRMIIDEQPAPPRSLDQRVPRDLEVICLKCLSKEPGGRYVSADALADDLKRWRQGHPIEARPAGWGERAVKWAWRNPLVSALAASVLTASILAVAFAMRASWAERNALFAQNQERAQRILANENEKKARAETASKEQALGAERRARRLAEKYADFFEEDLLGSAKAEHGRSKFGADITLGKVLWLAERQIPLRFEGEAYAQAKAHRAIGETWSHLVEDPAALRNIRRAIAICDLQLMDAKSLTESNRRRWQRLALESRCTLGLELYRIGQSSDAVRLLEKTLDRMKAELGRADPLRQKCQFYLAKVYIKSERRGEGRKLLEKTVRESEALLGSDHAETLLVSNDLAGEYKFQGEFAKAIELQRRVSARAAEALGETDRRTIMFRANLATTYFVAGQFKKGIPILEKAVKQSAEYLGQAHPRTFLARRQLALALRKAGRLKEAIPHYRQTLKQAEAEKGVADALSVNSRKDLRSALQQLGDWDGLIRVQRESLKRSVAELGEGHDYTLKLRHAVASAYERANLVEEALPIYERVLVEAESKYGRGHGNTFTFLNNLAAAYWKVSRFKKSVPLFERLALHTEKRLGSNHPFVLLAKANLGVNYKDAGQPLDAIPLLEDVQRRLKKAPPSVQKRMEWVDAALKDARKRLANQSCDI